MLSRIFFMVIAATVLSACGAMKKPPAPTIEAHYIQIPEYLTQPCYILSPPDPGTYLKLKIEERELAALNFGRHQTHNLVLCDQQVSAIRDWNQKQTDQSKAKD